jgi:hypothetical protein
MKRTIFFLVAAIVAVGAIATVLDQQYASASLVGFPCSHVNKNVAVCSNPSTGERCVFTGTKGMHGPGCE